MAGGGNYGQDSLFVSVDPTTGQEQWRQFLPREPGYEPYGNLYFAPQAVYSADGNTGYMAADINGDQSWAFQQKHLLLYAVNTGAYGRSHQPATTGHDHEPTRRSKLPEERADQYHRNCAG